MGRSTNLLMFYDYMKLMKKKDGDLFQCLYKANVVSIHIQQQKQIFGLGDMN